MMSLPKHACSSPSAPPYPLAAFTGICIANGLIQRIHLSHFTPKEPIMTKPHSNTRIMAIMVVAFTFSTTSAHAIDIWTAAVNNTRQGWNKFETILTPASVPGLKKLREFPVDEKVDVSPLVIGNKLYVFSMRNTAYIFDVNTGAQLSTRQLAQPINPANNANPNGEGMDMWNIYQSWGISATPVIDTSTNTLYVVTFGKSNPNGSSAERSHTLWILDAGTLLDKQAPVVVEGNPDNGGTGIANRFAKPYQKMRSGLGLLTATDGNKAVILSFSMNGENPQGPGHGFVVAYDVRGLNREPGFTPTPSIWSVTPDGGSGGIWMSGSGSAIENNDIYFATGNGMDPGTKPNNFAESFVKLGYTPGVANVNNGKPQLQVNDYWGAFSDFTRSNNDQDLGSSGIFITEKGSLVGGGKDGILYNLDKTNLGKNSWTPQFNLPFAATYLPNPPNGLAGLPTNTPTDPNWPIINLDRAENTPDGKTHHIHGTPVYLETATQGFVYVWGENATLKVYNYDFATRQITKFFSQGTQISSGQMQPPGGMPGGRLTVSSNGTQGGGVIWAVYPPQGNANVQVVHGALVAYDATKNNNGTLKLLFNSDAKASDNLGNFAKFATPVVANGKVYVSTFSNKVVQYGP